MTAVTVWDGSTDNSWTDATNWSNGVPSTSKIASIPSGLSTYPDLASDCTVHALELESGATLTGGSNITVYVTGESSGETDAPPDGYAVNLDGAISGELSFNIATPAETALDLTPSSGNVHDLTINHASCDAGIDNAVTLTGDLTVSLGIFEIGNYAFQLVNYAESGSGRVEMYQNTVTCTGDWKGPNTKLMANGSTFNITGKMGGAWDCNSKESTINCATFHSTVSMTNGTGLVSGNTAEKVIVTATANADPSPIYGPLQGKINLVTASSGNKNFVMKEDLTINGRIIVSGDGEFRTYDGSNTYDLHIDGQTYHDDNGGSGYSCLAMEGSSQFLSGSSSVILDVSLGNNICDIGEFNGTDGQNVTGWTPYGSNTIVYDSNSAKITYVDNSTGAYFMLNSTALSVSSLTVGKVYKCTFDAKINTGSVNLKWTTQSSLPFGAGSETHAYLSGATTKNETLTNTSYEKRVAYFVAGFTSVYLYVSNMSSGEVVHIDNMTVQEVVANGKDGTTAQHMKSYGFDYASSNEQSNLGTGFMYTCGLRGHHSYQLNKTSGRLVVGSGDANEYFTHTALLNLGSTDIILLGNAGGEDTLGINVSTASATWTCAGFYYHLTASNKHLYYWNHGAGGNASGSDGDASRTAGRTHTITGKVKILQGELRTGYISGSSHNGTGLNWGETHIYNGGKLECDQTNSTDDSNMEVDSTFDSMLVDSGGTLSLSPTTTFIESEASSHAFRISGGGTLENNDGTLEIKTAGSTRLTMNGTGDVHNLTVNHGSCNLFLEGDTSTTIEGNLIITQGTVTPTTEGGANRNLIVTGDVEIENGGQLTGGSSSITMGSLATGLAGAGGTYSATSGTTTITKYRSNGKAIYGNGPIIHNSGTFAFTNTDDYGSIQIQLEGGAGSAGTQFNDVTFSGNSTYRFPYYGMGAGITISGDLEISDTVEIKQWRRNMIITGKMTINSGCVYDCEGSGVAGVDTDFTAGTLEIASGGTFKASSNTTTITTGGTVAGTSDMAFGGEGTFTHNKGTLVLDSVLHRIPAGGTFYNVKLTGSQNTGGIYAYTTSLLPQPTMPDGGSSANNIHIQGTLTITDDEFRPYNTDKIWIHNLVIGDGTGALNSAKFDMQEVDAFDGTVFVDNVTIHSDGQFLFGDGDETSSTAGSSALNVYGSFRNLGGNVTIE